MEWRRRTSSAPVAYRKEYLTDERFRKLIGEYNECSAMLRAIDKPLEKGKPTKR